MLPNSTLQLFTSPPIDSLPSQPITQLHYKTNPFYHRFFILYNSSSHTLSRCLNILIKEPLIRLIRSIAQIWTRAIFFLHLKSIKNKKLEKNCITSESKITPSGIISDLVDSSHLFIDTVVDINKNSFTPLSQLTIPQSSLSTDSQIKFNNPALPITEDSFNLSTLDDSTHLSEQQRDEVDFFEKIEINFEETNNKLVFRIIPAPALGNCFFYTIWLGLQFLHFDNKKVQDLNSTISLNDLNLIHLVDQPKILAEEVAQLRTITITYLTELLTKLQSNSHYTSNLEKFQDRFHKLKNPKPGQQRAIKQLETLTYLKSAIVDHNEEIDKKIADSIDSYEKNKERYIFADERKNVLLTHLDILMALPLAEINRDEIEKLNNEIASFNQASQEAALGLMRNSASLLELYAKKIHCNPSFFEAKEISELLKFVQNFMAKDMYYANSCEAHVLSSFFEVPIIIDAGFGAAHLTVINPHFETTPIYLKYDGCSQHYDLLVEESVLKSFFQARKAI